jgi:hypothetical protein
MESITFPASAAWNEAIKPALENPSLNTPEQFTAILDSIATQLTNSNISPNQLTFPSSSSSSTINNSEKQQLVNLGARCVLEAILASYVPGTDEETIRKLLMSKKSTATTTSGIVGEPLTSKPHAAAAAAIWGRYGKKIANAQRNRAIEEVCQRVLSSSSVEKDDDANILRYVSSEVRICTHAASEESTNENNKHDLFKPFANFAIAPENCDQQQQQQQQDSSTRSNNGVVLQLSAAQTYDFLCEIDAIQRKLDELRG